MACRGLKGCNQAAGHLLAHKCRGYAALPKCLTASHCMVEGFVDRRFILLFRWVCEA